MPPSRAVEESGSSIVAAMLDKEEAQYVHALELKFGATATLHCGQLPPLPEILRQRYRKSKMLIQVHADRFIVLDQYICSHVSYVQSLLRRKSVFAAEKDLKRYRGITGKFRQKKIEQHGTFLALL